MGARILSVAVARPKPFRPRQGGRKLAHRAMLTCLERGGRHADELDILINAGIYHEDNLGEPALAALLQRDVAANPRLGVSGTPHGTFSFDVQNGGVGVLNAFHLLDGFLSSAIALGMVVASDADPGSPVEPEFPFPAVGGAALLGPSDGEHPGFLAFHFDRYPEYEHLFGSSIRWHPGRLGRGRNVLEIEQLAGFEERAVECAAESLQRFLDETNLSTRDIDLLVPSQFPARFADDLLRRVGLRSDRVALVGEELEGVHTAGPLAAFLVAERDGRLAEAKTVVFLAIGAGIDVGLALYRTR